jgi:hypothetical protein
VERWPWRSSAYRSSRRALLAWRRRLRLGLRRELLEAPPRQLLEWRRDLRIAIGEVDVLATLTAATYDREDWVGSDPDVVEGVASLLGLIKKSAATARAAFHRLHGTIADAAPAGERWDGKGTAPGEGADPAAQDADIVRRIRERCPDGRFDGGSDAELIQLFKPNKQVLSRTDDDVIAAMTHQK